MNVESVGYTLVTKYDPKLHGPDTVSRTGVCAFGRGGGSFCFLEAEFTVDGPEETYATCGEHLPGTVRKLLGGKPYKT